MATRLRKISYDRIDLVDRGANQHAHVMLYKRATDADAVVATLTTLQRLSKEARALVDEVLPLESVDVAKEAADVRSFDDALGAQMAHREVGKIGDLWYLFCETAHQIVSKLTGAERNAKLTESAKQFASAVATAIGALVSALESGEGVQKMAQRFATQRDRAWADVHLITGETSMAGTATMDQTDVQKRIDDAVAAAVTKLQSETDSKIAKAREEGKQEGAAELKKAQDAATEAQRIAKAERDTRITAEMTTFAKSLSPLPTLAVDGEQSDVPLFKRLSEGAGTVEDWTRVRDLFSKAAEALRTAKAMTEIGSISGGDPSRVAPESAEAEIGVEAEKLVKADATGRLTKAQAIAQIVSDPKHAALTKRYNAESADARRAR